MNDFDKTFDETFIENTQNNPVKSILGVCNYIAQNSSHNIANIGLDSDYSVLVQGITLINWINKKYALGYDNCDIEGYIGEYSLLKEHANTLHVEVKRAAMLNDSRSAHDKYDKVFEDKFIYKFSEESINKIQALINELRDKIEASNLFEDKHKQRLLKRLEKLQVEMHKKMSNIDLIWGFVGDAGVVFGKFGKDAKPLVDRIIEIAKIGWKTQSQAENLPTDIEHPSLKDLKNLQ